MEVAEDCGCCWGSELDFVFFLFLGGNDTKGWQKEFHGRRNGEKWVTGFGRACSLKPLLLWLMVQPETTRWSNRQHDEEFCLKWEVQRALLFRDIWCCVGGFISSWMLNVCVFLFLGCFWVHVLRVSSCLQLSKDQMYWSAVNETAQWRTPSLGRCHGGSAISSTSSWGGETTS